MKKSISSLRLGATLYAPAIRPDLSAIISGERYPDLRSVILCTEDSILPQQVDAAIANLGECFPTIGADRPLIFVRPRNVEVFSRILDLPGVEKIDGFVLPKITRQSLIAYLEHAPERFLLMPTLETREIFDRAEVEALRDLMCEPAIKRRILALRIGGNDILNMLGIRRRSGRTIYHTAAGAVIGMLVAEFKPFGFSLTAPVFDDFGDPDTLAEEVMCDLEHGLIGKTAIHPAQIGQIERHYRVEEDDLDMACRILNQESAGVFQVNQVMCEPATHSHWAQITVEQVSIFGVIPKRRMELA